MLNFSKSKYCGLWQCPKIAWLNKFKPEEKKTDASGEARMVTGNEVGDLAMGLFGDYVEVTAYSDDKPDLPEMIRRTEEEMKNGTRVICEASFSYNGLYCAVDILKKCEDGWEIYEVKSSTHGDKPVYIADVAYQKYVLEHCGVNVKKAYTVVINNEYVFDGTLDLQKLFKITDITEYAEAEKAMVDKNLSLAEKILADENEPDYRIGLQCSDPYECAYWDYCSRDIPSPSVFDLYRMSFKNKIQNYYSGIVTFNDVLSSDIKKSDIIKKQIEHALNDIPAYIDGKKIGKFLTKLSYPLYFLDFETMQPVVPQFVGTKPFSQIPFQYSLHYIEKEGGELKHSEFLAESGTDPRRAIAESLCRDIPMNVCITAYNKSFECSRIKELAAIYPDLSDHLLNIADHIVDLLEPFSKGMYYNRAMGSSFSIKSVLPALFPNDPELNYHNLDGVHNGSEAMSIFPMIKDMPAEEQKKARTSLLKYCELDTYAMVKVWEELERVKE